MKKDDPFLWFDNRSKGAVMHYVDVFKNNDRSGHSIWKRGHDIRRMAEGMAMTVIFEVEGGKNL